MSSPAVTPGPTGSQPPGGPGAGDRSRYPWVAMGVVLTGTFMVILDTTIINVALPAIGDDLASAAGIEWVITGYLIAVGVAQLATGWISDRFGKKATYTWSLGLFAAGSALAALSPSLPMLIVFRILQGLGGGAMMPVGLAMLYELFPPDRRGTALGIWGIAAMAAPAIGPVAGGWIATSVSWRWIFAVNIPIGAVGVALAVRLLRDVGFREHRPLDVRALAMAAIGLVALLFAFDNAPDWGWTSPGFLALTAAGLAVLVAFVRRELGSQHPLLEMRMFTVPTFTITIAIVWLITVAQFARLVLVPVELQTVHGLTAFEAGLLLAPAAVGTAITMSIGGRITDRIGPRTPVVAGSAAIATAVWLLGTITPDTRPATILVYLMVQGAGTGLALVPNTVAAMNALPARWISRAAAVRSLNRQIAGSIGVAILASIVVAQIGTLTGTPGTDPVVLQDAYNDAFHLAFACALAATALAFRLPGRHETLRLQDERTAEYQQLDLS